MEKVVNFQERRRNKKQKENVLQYRGKVETIQKIIQCSSCHIKCAMCGLHIDSRDIEAQSDTSSLGLTFCESCHGEFQDFLATSKGKKPSDVFWHNEKWAKMWSAWLNYRRALNAFVDSQEFRLLLEELNPRT